MTSGDLGCLVVKAHAHAKNKEDFAKRNTRKGNGKANEGLTERALGYQRLFRCDQSRLFLVRSRSGTHSVTS